MNRYPLWKYILIVVIIGVSIIFALPNLYGKDPAVQVSASRSGQLNELITFDIEEALENAGISYKRIDFDNSNLIVRFENEDIQLKAQDAIKEALGNAYIVALNLAPATPGWLRKIGAEPMFLGLDLRGGVHFLLEVDIDAAIEKAEERYVSDIRSQLREEDVRYKTISRDSNGGVTIRFRDSEQRDEGISIVKKNFIELDVSEVQDISGEFPANARLNQTAREDTRVNAVQQNITTLRKRVNELGVTEPVIQQQGQNRIVVQLPGIQDTARAKEILGATATLEFRMVDQEHSVQDALDGRVPPGSKLYSTRDGQQLLVKKQIMLTGDYIIGASSGIDPTSGGPDVSITLDGKGDRIFRRATSEEVGKNMAIIFIENKTETIEKDGEIIKKKEIIEEVISNATILQQLGKRFHITGLDSTQEARNLALTIACGCTGSTHRNY